MPPFFTVVGATLNLGSLKSYAVAVLIFFGTRFAGLASHKRGAQALVDDSAEPVRRDVGVGTADDTRHGWPARMGQGSGSHHYGVRRAEPAGWTNHVPLGHQVGR